MFIVAPVSEPKISEVVEVFEDSSPAPVAQKSAETRTDKTNADEESDEEPKTYEVVDEDQVEEVRLGQ